MRFRRLLRVAWARVLRGFAKVFKRFRQVDGMVQVDVGDGAKHDVIRIVALFGFQKIAQRLFVPAVQVCPFRSRAIRPGFALEFGQPDFLQDIEQRGVLHFQLPDDVAQQRREIRLELRHAAGQRGEIEFQRVERIAHFVPRQTPQSPNPPVSAAR